mmetsp:Transcript_38277/g.53139  ORF Transcript_38277/g.53139 Transcript_38277/m.53139 type:complete len:345 (+) Transcript_38277:132-1166(+)|eukprot:CAMPEP_0196583102 /NCGR_PEP_ID=MMETSP1081-20130531/41995_1 /TAXON_ID=36882 /ORGANISM="Pyramimonas amylifera, Strain CCMP720" /LENGTH=344 /DNA_ID=CAMNT_0041903873 /DNA_START=198 /DNA_END=1232 /DNA_ORIENTATION=+
METNSNVVGPALSVGGSNISSDIPLDEDVGEHSDGVYQPPISRRVAGAVNVGPTRSIVTAGHSIFTEPRKLANGVTGSTSTVYGVARQGLSNADSNAQATASVGVSFEGPAAASTRQDEEVHFDEVAGPIRRVVSQSVSVDGGGSRQDDDSAEARYEEVDEGEELDSLKVSGLGGSKKGGQEAAFPAKPNSRTSNKATASQEATGGPNTATGAGGAWVIGAQCDDNSAAVGGSMHLGGRKESEGDMSGEGSLRETSVGDAHGRSADATLVGHPSPTNGDGRSKPSTSEDGTVETNTRKRRNVSRENVARKTHVTTVNSGYANQIDHDGESEEEGDEFVSKERVL